MTAPCAHVCVRGPMRKAVGGRPLNSVVRQLCMEAIAKRAESTWIVNLAIAVVAEVIYVAGRTLINARVSGELEVELARTAWRLVFVALYVWLALSTLRRTRVRKTYAHPLLISAVVLTAVVTPFGGGFIGDRNTLLVFILATPIVAIREELFYRVILQGSLERVCPPLIAILLSTALFVPIHIGMQPMTPVGVFQLATSGVLLGVIYQRTRNILAVVVIHIVLDWLVLGPPVGWADPLLVAIANLVSALAALAWWSIDNRKHRLGI